MAPFKLPQDYIDILGGFDSPEFAKFKELFKRCFRDVRKHAERIITLVELMQKGKSHLLCSNRQEREKLTCESNRFKPTLFREWRFDFSATEGTLCALIDPIASRGIRREVDPQFCDEFIHETLRVCFPFPSFCSLDSTADIHPSIKSLPRILEWDLVEGEGFLYRFRRSYPCFIVFVSVLYSSFRFPAVSFEHIPICMVSHRN